MYVCLRVCELICKYVRIKCMNLLCKRNKTKLESGQKKPETFFGRVLLSIRKFTNTNTRSHTHTHTLEHISKKLVKYSRVSVSLRGCVTDDVDDDGAGAEARDADKRRGQYKKKSLCSSYTSNK